VIGELLDGSGSRDANVWTIQTLAPRIG
jgi:hypothetical protein